MTLRDVPPFSQKPVNVRDVPVFLYTEVVAVITKEGVIDGI